MADMNGDGISDLIAGFGANRLNDSIQGGIWIFPGNGDGTFGPGTHTVLKNNANLSTALSLTVGDANGDGTPDVLMTAYDDADGLEIDLIVVLNTPLYCPIIPGQGVIEAAIEVPFPFRGRHRENLFAISARFPFGRLRKTTVVPLRRGDHRVSIARTGRRRPAHARSDSYRIRPYEATDNARLVDWKTTAHTGSLQVREFSQKLHRFLVGTDR